MSNPQVTVVDRVPGTHKLVWRMPWREPPAEQHAGNSTTPILGNDTTKTDNPNHKITSRAS